MTTMEMSYEVSRCAQASNTYGSFDEGTRNRSVHRENGNPKCTQVVQCSLELGSRHPTQHHIPPRLYQRSTLHGQKYRVNTLSTGTNFGQRQRSVPSIKRIVTQGV